MWQRPFCRRKIRAIELIIASPFAQNKWPPTSLSFVGAGRVFISLVGSNDARGFICVAPILRRVQHLTDTAIPTSETYVRSGSAAPGTTALIAPKWVANVAKTVRSSEAGDARVEASRSGSRSWRRSRCKSRCGSGNWSWRERFWSRKGPAWLWGLKNIKIARARRIRSKRKVKGKRRVAVWS